jgi:hypothetical protein
LKFDVFDNLPASPRWNAGSICPLGLLKDFFRLTKLSIDYPSLINWRSPDDASFHPLLEEHDLTKTLPKSLEALCVNYGSDQGMVQRAKADLAELVHQGKCAKLRRVSIEQDSEEQWNGMVEDFKERDIHLSLVGCYDKTWPSMFKDQQEYRKPGQSEEI